MRNDNDMIRRGDALKAIDPGHGDFHAGNYNAIRALPAAPDLSDPVTVHANMLRGSIAKLTLDQVVHIYGIDAICRHLAPMIVREDSAMVAAEREALQARLAAAEKMAEALHGAEVTVQNLISVMGTPDQRQCCDGRECGCMGATVYQEAEYYAGKDLKAVVAALEKWRAGK